MISAHHSHPLSDYNASDLAYNDNNVCFTNICIIIIVIVIINETKLSGFRFYQRGWTDSLHTVDLHHASVLESEVLRNLAPTTLPQDSSVMHQLLSGTAVPDDTVQWPLYIRISCIYHFPGPSQVKKHNFICTQTLIKVKNIFVLTSYMHNIYILPHILTFSNSYQKSCLSIGILLIYPFMKIL